jgi:AcrR family transcriptional regulator
VVKRARASKPDRRVARTRRQLRDALVSLVIERGWDEVTLTDVCERADLGRSTLYVHFADKENLLLSGFRELEASLESVQRGAPGTFAFARELLAHTQGNLQLFRALVATNAGRYVVLNLRDISVRLVAADLKARRTTPPHPQLLARYIAGGLVELILMWLEKPTRQSADELADAFLALTRNSLG